MMTHHPNAHISTPMNPYVTYAPNASSHAMMDGRLHPYPTSAPTSPPPGWSLVSHHHAISGGIAPYPGIPTSLPMARLGDAPHQMSDPNMIYGAPTLVPPRSASEAGYHYNRPGTSHSPALSVEQSYNAQVRSGPPTSQGQPTSGYHSRSSSFHQPQSPSAPAARTTPTLHQPKATHPSSASNVVVPITHSPEPGASSYSGSGAFAGSATPPTMTTANGGRYPSNTSREESVPYAAPTISPAMSPSQLPRQTTKPASSGRYAYEGNGRDEFGGGPYYPSQREATYNSSTSTPPASTSNAAGAQASRPSGLFHGWNK
ncbi:hypothetical protein BJ165DRAFT_1449751 [Panaeolus papilionaceus]|nr:hypothetical protein BJ165DRAFT_1449751 [Panaeolus papilionaceus]